MVLDTDVDTTRANGELIANIVISIAQWERRIIGERTREALEEKRRVRRQATSVPTSSIRRSLVFGRLADQAGSSAVM